MTGISSVDCSACRRDHHCEFLISFGYPADEGLLTAPPRPGRRKPLESIVHEERW